MWRLAGKFSHSRGRFLLPSSPRAVNVEKACKLTGIKEISFYSFGDFMNSWANLGKETPFLFDKRTPFPGNVGIAPHLLSISQTVRLLPPHSHSIFDAINEQSSQERQSSVCTQAVVALRSETLFGEKNIEFKGFTCPELVKNDFQNLFPHRDLSEEKFTVITICLKTEHDMNTWSEASEDERIKHETFFHKAALMIKEHLCASNYWAEFVHPSTGKLSGSMSTYEAKQLSQPVINDTMYQTDLRYTKLGLMIEDLGCCRIISHPEFGNNVFNGVIFTNADIKSVPVKSLLNRVFLRGLHMHKNFYEV